ncbi:hypothetical protein [Paraburkholderia sp. ZP32-5]|uniref:hypothetical protein n=1 Tax=Paraburkholderia sp. ZP32-5 TaxID=2883245 RepID=UPI001F24515D|nr:hypothetical protein [Paraburkholderia sp. ZP32-5]
MQATAHGDNIAMLHHPLKTTIQALGNTRALKSEEVSPIVDAFAAQCVSIPHSKRTVHVGCVAREAKANAF